MNLVYRLARCILQRDAVGARQGLPEHRLFRLPHNSVIEPNDQALARPDGTIDTEVMRVALEESVQSSQRAAGG